MAHPRTAEDSDNYWRRAAVERLRQMGISVHRFRQNAEGVASAIRLIEPKFRGGDPNLVIRAWMGAVARPKQLPTVRPYVPSALMRFMADRAKDQPVMHALVSNVYEYRDMPEV